MSKNKTVFCECIGYAHTHVLGTKNCERVIIEPLKATGKGYWVWYGYVFDTATLINNDFKFHKSVHGWSVLKTEELNCLNRIKAFAKDDVNGMVCV